MRSMLRWPRGRMSRPVAAMLMLSGLLATGEARAETLNMAGVKVEVIERRLDNGLTILMVENHQSPTIGLIVQFAVGSVDEWDGISGSAHILEHMLFKGTADMGSTDWKKEKALLDQVEQTAQQLRLERGKESRGDMGRLLLLETQLDSLQKAARAFVVPNPYDPVYSENGGQGLNAGTSWDGTNYEIALPSNRLELWMKIESDRLKAPVLREFYTELNNIMEERRLRTDDQPGGPLGKVGESMYAAAYTAHRYGVPIIGWPSDIQRVTRTEVETFFKKYYAPNRVTLGIVGDIDPDRVHELAKAYFGSIPRQPDPVPPRTIEPAQKGERRFEIEYEAETRVFMAWHITDGHHADYPALLMLEGVLAQGRSSRLLNSVVEKQKLASAISSYTGIPGERYPGLLILEATPLSPHTTVAVEEAIYAEIDRLKKEPPTEGELDAAKLRFRKGFVNGLQDNLGLAAALAYNNATLGDWRDSFRRAESVAKVTPADIQRVASTYFTRANRTVGTLIKPMVEAAFVDPKAMAEAMDFLAKARASLGKESTLAGVKDLTIESTMTIYTPQGNISGSEKQTMTLNGRMKNELAIMGQTQVQALDGETGWILGPEGAMDAPADALAEMREGLTREIYLLKHPAGAPNGIVRRLPDGDFQGAPSVILEVNPVEGKPFHLYLDPTTMRPRGRSFDTDNPLTGAPGRAEEALLDWQDVSGLLWPTKEEIWMGGEKILDKLTIKRTVNSGLKSAEFKKPS
ncbi:MAG: pitrilysin family protein [Candidatus Eisenbacteria bacterium]|nr:pitrilysin family protein [Candidatus Eisenbacteria bacterium]